MQSSPVSITLSQIAVPHPDRLQNAKVIMAASKAKNRGRLATDLTTNSQSS